MASEEPFAQSDFGLDPSDDRIPSPEDFLKALENMEGVDEDMKQQLRESILSGGQGAMKNLFSQEAAAVAAEDSKLTLLVGLVLVVVLLLVFFGYKLYTSLVERERKREEKRKQKQQKKKK